MTVGRREDEAGSARAADLYAAALDAPAPGRPRVVAALRGVLLGLGAMAGWYDEPPAGDVVVRRRDDGREVLRVDAGPSEEAAALLAHVRDQLRTMSPRLFRETWGALDPAHGASAVHGHHAPEPGEGPR